MKKALILAGINWNNSLQRHHQFTNYLVSCGYEVYFVEHIISTKFTIHKLVQEIFKTVWKCIGKNRTKVVNTKTINIKIISLKFVNPGGHIFYFINKSKASKLGNYIPDTIDLVINYLPVNTTRFILDRVNYKKLIYDCVRNFEEWGGCYRDISCEEKKLIEKSDMVFTDSYFLTEKMRNLNSNKKVVQFLPTVTLSWISGVGNGKKIETIKCVGYFGSLDKHIDSRVFYYLNQKGIEVHIWGEIGIKTDFDFVFHGYINDLNKLSKEIMKYCDAIVMPYIGNMNGVIPAKTLQCLQTKLPVYISTFYDSIKLKDVLYVYDNIEDLVEMIQKFDSFKHIEKLKRIDELLYIENEENQYKKFVDTINCI